MSEANAMLDLGKLLGKREALGAVAGRCSAAEAACIREIRESKQYTQLAPSWAEFCDQHLHMSKTHADRIIRLLEEFGPDYFELTQLLRIPPEAYRAIASAIKDRTIECNGEAIELIPANAAKVAAAVLQLRQLAGGETGGTPVRADRISALQRRCNAAISEFT